MRENLVWAGGYTVFAIPLAAGVLAPWGILLSPAIGALLMSLSTIIVAINAQFLLHLGHLVTVLTSTTRKFEIRVIRLKQHIQLLVFLTPRQFLFVFLFTNLINHVTEHLPHIFRIRISRFCEITE